MLLHSLDYSVLDRLVRGMPPPQQHIRASERLLGESVLRLREGGRSHVDPREQARQGRSDRVMHAVWVDSYDVLIANLVNVLVPDAVSYTHLRAHETRHDLVCRLLLEKKKK